MTTESSDRARQVIEAFNASDWPGLQQLLADAVVYQETGTGRRVKGADAYIALCQDWKQAFPDVIGTIQTAVTGAIIAQEVIWEGIQTGPLPTPSGMLPASGKQVRMLATLWYRLVWAPRVREVRHHMDVLTVLQQIGALPAGEQMT